MGAATREPPPTHQVVLTFGATGGAALLFAPVEGAMRLIEAVPLDAAAGDGSARGVRELAARTGYPLAAGPGAIDGVIVAPPPLAVLLIGAREEGDAAALARLRQTGAARYLGIPSAPPERPDDDRAWVQRVLAALHSGEIEVICAVLPADTLPLWAVHLFDTLTTEAGYPPPELLVLSSGTDPAFFPWFARPLTRGPTLADQAAAALAAIAVAWQAPGITPAPPAMLRTHALATAVIAAQRVAGGTVAYCDIGDGTTLITADDAGAAITCDAQWDCGCGAATLLAAGQYDAIARWLPPDITAATLNEWAMRRAAAPDAVLLDPTDRAIARGFARVAVAHALGQHARDLAACDTLILGAGWPRWTAPGDALRLIADVLAPPSPLHVSLDHDDLLAATGLLAQASPASAESLFARDALHPLGTMIAPRLPQRPAAAPSLTLTTAGQTVQVAIPPEIMLRGIKEPTECEIRVAGAAPQVFAVAPSECGLLIDARPRPLARARAMHPPPASVSDRLRAAPQRDADGA